jgi:hypothetical protein
MINYDKPVDGMGYPFSRQTHMMGYKDLSEIGVQSPWVWEWFAVFLLALKTGREPFEPAVGLQSHAKLV